MEKSKKVFVEQADDANKEAKLVKLLGRSNFLGAVRQKCGKKGKACKIVVKTNLAPASQVNYHYITDPTLVDRLVDYIRGNGYRNVKIIESETKAVLADPRLKPDKIAGKVGYRHPVVNISGDKRTKVDCGGGKGMELADTMLSADVIINFAKAKNHDWARMTGALKNMYGTIPDLDKHRLFHKKASGMNIAEATACVNAITPSDFVLVDWVDSVDGNEKSYYSKPIEQTDFKPVWPFRLVAGEDALAVDKYLAAKMGYEEDDVEIIRKSAVKLGDFVLSAQDVVGDDLSVLPFWKRVSELTRLKVAVQDKLPVPDSLTGYFIRKYHFDVV